MNQRLYRYDLLRTISIFSVILAHIGAVYTKEDYQAYVGTFDYSIGLLFSLLTRTCVPCFVMLSGAFMIHDKNINFTSFYQKTWKKIIIPTFIFSILYVLYAYAQILLAKVLNIPISEEMGSLTKPLLWLLQGRPHTIMWYMYMLIGIYLITPIIVMIKQHICEQTFFHLSIVMLFYGILVRYTCNLSWILWFAEWIGYFMMGYTLKEYALKKGQHHKGLLLILCSVLLLTVNYGLALSNRFPQIDFADSFSPLIVLSSLLIFTGFSMIEPKKEFLLISLIGKNTLTIYFVHILFIDPVFQILGRVLKWFPNALFILPYGIVVLFLSLGCKLLYDFLCNGSVISK